MMIRLANRQIGVSLSINRRWSEAERPSHRCSLQIRRAEGVTVDDGVTKADYLVRVGQLKEISDQRDSHERPLQYRMLRQFRQHSCARSR
jgi:hypothetical protein